MRKILVFTATYNEIENIKSFLDKIINVKENFDILIVDDNSPDKTWSAIENYKLQNSKKIKTNDIVSAISLKLKKTYHKNFKTFGRKPHINRFHYGCKHILKELYDIR